LDFEIINVSFLCCYVIIVFNKHFLLLKDLLPHHL